MIARRTLLVWEPAERLPLWEGLCPSAANDNECPPGAKTPRPVADTLGHPAFAAALFLIWILVMAFALAHINA